MLLGMFRGAITMSYPITPEVEAISRLHIEGNVIPHTWFQHIRTPAGHPDVLAIMILSDVVYWYRWRELRDEATGAVVGYARRFKGDRLQRSYDALAQQYGFTKRQVQDAVYRLVDAGLLARDLRTIITDNGVKLGNVLYLAPIADAIAAITYHADHPLSRKNVRGITEKRERYPEKTGEVSRFDVIPLTKKRETNTEITTEITTETTTIRSSINGNGEDDFADEDDDLDADDPPEQTPLVAAAVDSPAEVSAAAAASQAENAAAGPQAEVCDLLAAFGIVEPNLGKIARRGVRWANAQAWIWAVQGKNLTNAPGMVVSRLLAGDPPPPALLDLAQQLQALDAAARAALPELAAAQRADPWFRLEARWRAAGLTPALLKAYITCCPRLPGRAPAANGRRGG